MTYTTGAKVKVDLFFVVELTQKYMERDAFGMGSATLTYDESMSIFLSRPLQWIKSEILVLLFIQL